MKLEVVNSCVLSKPLPCNFAIISMHYQPEEWAVFFFTNQTLVSNRNSQSELKTNACSRHYTRGKRWASNWELVTCLPFIGGKIGFEIFSQSLSIVRGKFLFCWASNVVMPAFSLLFPHFREVFSWSVNTLTDLRLTKRIRLCWS